MPTINSQAAQNIRATHPTESGRTRKYLGLQILRIVAAVLVLIVHSTFYASERLDKHFPVWGVGARGVDIFFVLSGFVMIYSSTKLFATVSGWKIFAERRIVRIVPIYWIATTFKVLALLLSSGYILHAHFSLLKSVESYLFLPSVNVDGEIRPVLGVGWTLNFEMFFYSLFAIALLLQKNVYKFVGAALCLLTVGAYFRQPDWPVAAFYLDPIVLDFFYGMLIAKICLANKQLPRYLAVPSLAFGFICLLTPISYPFHLATLLTGLFAALIVYSMASLEDWLTRVPRFILYMADASYAIYLFHPLIAPSVPTLLKRLNLIDPVVSTICSVSLALAVGCLVHKFVEDPISKWFRNHLLMGGKKVIHMVSTGASVVEVVEQE